MKTAETEEISKEEKIFHFYFMHACMSVCIYADSLVVTKTHTGNTVQFLLRQRDRGWRSKYDSSDVHTTSLCTYKVGC